MQKLYRIFYVIIIVFVLFLLGLFCDKKSIESGFENRNLEVFPKKFDNEQIERYFSDRIAFRDWLLRIYFSLDIELDYSSNTVLVGKKGWLFSAKNPESINLPVLKNYQNKPILKQSDYQLILENLRYIKKWCDQNNIQLYLLFPPDKSRVYAKYMPSYIMRKDALSPVEMIENLLDQDINYIPLEKELIETSKKEKEPLYYKEETHWSETGAFYVYQLLIKKMQENFPDLKMLDKTDFLVEKKNIFAPYVRSNQDYFYSGNLFQPKYKQISNLYNHYTFKHIDKINFVKDMQFRSSYYPEGHDLNVYIIGDSFATYLYHFLSATFKNIVAYRFNEPHTNWGILFEQRKEEMLSNHTNVLILSVSDLKLKDLLKVK